MGGTSRRQTKDASPARVCSLASSAARLEIVVKAVQSVNYDWIRRGPQTALTEKLMELTHTSTPAHAMEELATGRVEINPAWAPEIFAVAAAGDPVAVEVITWAGTELGELACAVIRPDRDLTR